MISYNKKNLCEALMDEGFTKQEALKAIDRLVADVRKQLAKGNSIQVRGFGTLSVVVRKAKKARDIYHNTIVEVPEHRDVKFTPSKDIKEALL
jgi:DNA-binding protein HU-beta